MSQNRNKPEELTLAQVIKNAIDRELYNLHVSLPVKVLSYRASEQKVEVQPLLKKKYFVKDTETRLPVISDVPVQWPSGNLGKSMIHIPLVPGDLGIVVISERSLDLWLSGEGNEVSPADTRKHNLSDAIFIPGVRPFKKAMTVSDTNMIIQHDKLKIEIEPNGKISISGVNEELLDLIDQLIDELKAALVITSLGSSPFTPATIAKFDVIKVKLSELLR
jgi:hypothetical protein